MAGIVPPPDQAADLLQTLSLDSQNQSSVQAADPSKKSSAVQYAPVDTGNLPKGLSAPFERSVTPFQQDFMAPSMFYSPSGYPSSTYYSGGYDGSSVNDWDRYVYPEGVDMSPGVYGDYQHGYSYGPYSTYSPSGSAVGHDAQLYGPQHYHYPTSYFQPSSTASNSYASNQAKAPQADVSTSISPEQVQLPIETAKGTQGCIGNVANSHTNVPKTLRPSYQSSSVKSNDSYGWGGMASASSGISSQFPHSNNFSSGSNHRPSHVMGLHPRVTSGSGQAGFTNRMYPNNRMYGQYGNSYRSGLGFVPNSYDPRISGNGWPRDVDDKYRFKGGNGLYGYERMDGLNELNRGPRAKGFKDHKDSEPVAIAVKGQTLSLGGKKEENSSPILVDREQFNKDDFSETYSDARFFVIKSYSEDDVHKSIKYGVWASTPNGNKKLDAAFREAQEKSDECPIFLLFSVNASGQFVGLAEMVGPVDFDKTLEYWQQDKWNGCFPVKWHIVKDVPNSMLRHIILENNENKPVTNSRDTQEVRLEQGIEVLKIFKSHSSRTCILDDFEFYERRQKTMFERKAKQRQFNQQVANSNSLDKVPTEVTDKDGGVTKQGLSGKSVDLGSTLTQDSLVSVAAVPEMGKTNGEVKQNEEDGSVAAVQDAFNFLQPSADVNKE